MAEVNEDSEDDCGVVSNKNPSYLLQSYKSFDILTNHSTLYLSVWSCNRADISGDKFACFDEEKVWQVFWQVKISDTYFTHI